MNIRPYEKVKSSMKSLSVTTLIAHNFMLYTFVHYALQYCEAYFTNWISEHFVCIVISNRFVTFLQQHRSIYLKSILCKQWNLYPIAKKDSNQLRQKKLSNVFLKLPLKKSTTFNSLIFIVCCSKNSHFDAK